MEFTTLQLYILKMLAEAGEENIPTIVNTVLNEALISDKANLIQEVNLALETLLNCKLIYYAYYQKEAASPWKILSDNEVQELSPIYNCLNWNEEGGFWSWRQDKCGKERVLVLISDVARDSVLHHFLT